MNKTLKKKIKVMIIVISALIIIACVIIAGLYAGASGTQKRKEQIEDKREEIVWKDEDEAVQEVTAEPEHTVTVSPLVKPEKEKDREEKPSEKPEQIKEAAPAEVSPEETTPEVTKPEKKPEVLHPEEEPDVLHPEEHTVVHPEEPAVPTVTPTVTPAPTVPSTTPALPSGEKMAVKVETIPGNEKIHIEYPVLSGGNSKEYIDGINAQWKKAAEQRYNDYIQSGDKTIQAVTVSVEICYTEGSVVSVMISEVVEKQGLHPVTKLYTQTYDTAREKKLELADLSGDTKEGTYKKIEQEAEKTDLVKNGMVSMDKIRACLPQGIVYYLEADGVHVVFQEGALGDYSYGMPELIIGRNKGKR